ncbi:TonB-linked SusC/RagA family outer membrane protein [Pedobacter africanus]|uniref:TonB-linked SusC/RagA family outer membrane protein n=1 Tax=Pedobacter africanus TaxID=151894 RepID=A0ACC6L424_9SPHI|nr:TonB-dependent receptor [Pedobacter africanus]MDR6786403.1 TonB-linked SusC/RagA family outer membrane protein [Pedobacter africanus]
MKKFAFKPGVVRYWVPPKILLIVKLIIVLLTACFLQVSASSFGQKLSYARKDASLREIFKQITLQTGYNVLYAPEKIAASKKLDVNFSNADLKTVLEKLAAEQSFVYSIEDKNIIIKPKEVSLLSKLVTAISEQNKFMADIRGVVLNEKGEALEGITVVVKGANRGTTTNAKGEFFLRNVDENAVLRISSIGYETREVAVKGSGALLTITINRSVSTLDEVQMIAYGTTTVRMNTGTVAKMKGEDIRRQPVDNPLLALGGRMPGVQIAQTNGLAGSPVSVLIRGKSSLGAASDPLYIIDGVPFAHSLSSITFSSGVSAQALGGLTSAAFRTNPFVAINPADIESIEVLKDADATAIYGSRGANGVVLITTRRAKSGKTTIDANFYTGWGRPTRMPEFMNTQQYVAMRKEAFRNDNITPTAANATDLMVWDTTRYTDWKKMLLGNTAKSTDAQVRLSGGSQQTTFSLAAGYHRETPIYTGDMNDDRGSFRANLQHRSADNKFQAAFNFGLSSDRNNIITTDLFQLINTIPNAPYPYDEKGDLIWRDKGINFSNPLAYLYKTYVGKTDNLITGLNLKYNVLTGLQLKVDAGYTAMILDQRTANPIKSQSPFGTNVTSSAEFYDQTHKNWIVEPQAEYTRQLGGGQLQVLLGSSFQEQLNEGTNISATGYSNDDLLEFPGLASSKAVSNSFTKYHYAALFGRINYNWKSKYLINLSARRDGSSRFGPGKQFGNFGAVGAAWVFSEEGFMKKALPFLNFGKLRASMGVTGNDRIGDYQYLSTWAQVTADNPYQGVTGLAPTRLYNPDFAWERNRKWEAALELSFLQDRIFFSADYYLNRTDNQLTGLTLPTQVGFGSITANRPAVLQNSGWELMLNTTNIQKKGLSWKTSFNITLPKNKLIAYPGIENTSFASIWQIGLPITIRKSIPYMGVDPQTGIYQLAGLETPKYQTAINDMAPKYYGGVQNTFEYKNFTLDFFFHFTKQKGMSSVQFSAPGARVNQTVEMLDRWQKAGDITNVQKFSTTGTAVTTYSYYANFSEARIVDASYLRLRNLSLSYRLDKAMVQKIKAQDVRLYFQGQNLLTFTPYKISDPETMSLSAMPPIRMLSVGLQVVF